MRQVIKYIIIKNLQNVLLKRRFHCLIGTNCCFESSSHTDCICTFSICFELVSLRNDIITFGFLILVGHFMHITYMTIMLIFVRNEKRSREGVKKTMRMPTLRKKTGHCPIFYLADKTEMFTDWFHLPCLAIIQFIALYT